jgi:hypothetical protein
MGEGDPYGEPQAGVGAGGFQRQCQRLPDLRGLRVISACSGQEFRLDRVDESDLAFLSDTDVEHAVSTFVALRIQRKFWRRVSA